MDQSRIPAAQGFKSQHWLKYQPTNVLDLTILFPIYMGYMTVYVCAYVYCITQPRALSRGQDQDRVR